jgi:hypothetical protein
LSYFIDKLSKEINLTEKLVVSLTINEEEGQQAGIKIEGITKVIEQEVVEMLQKGYVSKLKFI